MNEYQNFDWLPSASGPTPIENLNVDQIREYSKSKLDLLSTLKLSQHITERRHELEEAGSLDPVKLFAIDCSTNRLILDCFPAIGLRYGLNLAAESTEFGNAYQSLFLDDIIEKISCCDFVLLALDSRFLPLRHQNGAEEAIIQISQIIERIKTLTKKSLIVQNLTFHETELYGSADSYLFGTYRNNIKKVNSTLDEWARNSDFTLFDVEFLSSRIGLQSWHDPILWNSHKVPFSSNMNPIYCDNVCRIISALRGKTKKCLVLDLDNTIWGGVIGDDGVENIQLGEGSALGEAFLGFQNWCKELKNRGIILTVCSKNDEANAKLPFEKHPDTVMTLDDFSVFVANWNDKATNIKYISQTLNIGLDAMVFVDDSPYERAFVREQLPEVAVPEMPTDPSFYIKTLSSAGYFEGLSATFEDSQKTQLYQQEKLRKKLFHDVSDLKSFLESLKMTLEISSFIEVDIPRITQLINKTNQFNFTTKRYNEDEVRKIASSKNWVTVQARLSDKFGASGLISIIMGEIYENVLTIDNWLMSCRVFQRDVEFALCNHLFKTCGERGIHKITGNYKPTEKNKIVKELYKEFGFQFDAQKDEWFLNVAEFSHFETPHKIDVL